MKQINSIAEFEKHLLLYKDYRPFFRGQSSQYPTINASISREQGHSVNEHFFYTEALSKFEHEFESLKTPLKRLAKMQHYGIPTRLIDFTMCPYVALYFAVEDIDSKYAGNVYLYIQPAKLSDSKHVRLLSLLATQDNFDLERIKTVYSQMFLQEISPQEILKMGQKPAFIQPSKAFSQSNPRIASQEGTFVICANQVCDKQLLRGAIKPLESALPTAVFQVPFEYKASVKKDLDRKYDIRSWSVYPGELPPFAKYLKENYRLECPPQDGNYIVVNMEDVSYGLVRRLSITIVLKNALRIDQIREEAISIMQKYQPEYEVIWIYVAKSQDDLVFYNWLLQGQWINQNLATNFRPGQIGVLDDDGYSWVYKDSYEVMSNYFAEYYLEEDKVLYVSYFKTFDEFLPTVFRIMKAFKLSTEDFKNTLWKQADEINRMCDLFGFFGVSRNDKFNEFVGNFESLVLAFSNMLYGVDEKAEEMLWRKLIADCFQDAEKAMNYIEENREFWKEKLEVSEQDYNEIKPTRKEQPLFRQSIPINIAALEVDFKEKTSILPDCTIQVTGVTNLYNQASLLLTIFKNEKIISQSKTNVENGAFDFGVLSIKGSGYNPGNYLGKITLPIPGTQSEKFIKQAGIEYENLSGPYIRRTGIGGPTVEYEFAFAIP